MLCLTANKTYLYTGKQLIPLNPDKETIHKRVCSTSIGGRIYLSILDLIQVVCRKGIDGSSEVGCLRRGRGSW